MKSAFLQERSFLLRQPWVLFSWILLAATITLAMFEGQSLLDQRKEAIDNFSQDSWKSFDALRTAAAEVAAGERKVESIREANRAGRVTRVRVPANMPVTNIQAWSPGLWDLHPAIGEVGVFTPPSSFLELAKPRDPESEGWGRLDLTTVVVILLPLWLLVVFHDTCSHERDRGLFRILEGNGIPRERILARRLSAPIAIAFFGWTAAFIVGCVISNTWQGVGIAGLCWFLASLGYAVFWMGCFALIAARSSSTETSVMSALSAWMVIVILLPGLMDVVLRASSDPANGSNMVASQRVSAAEAERERAQVLSKYMFDHPELAEETKKGEFASDFLREYFVTQESVEVRLATVIQQQEEEANEKFDLVGKLSAFIPSAWAQGLLEGASGTGPRQMLEFRQHSRAYANEVRANLKPFLWRGDLLKPADFDSIPRISAAHADELPSLLFLRLLWLPFLGIVGLFLAWRHWLQLPLVR